MPDSLILGVFQAEYGVDNSTLIVGRGQWGGDCQCGDAGDKGSETHFEVEQWGRCSRIATEEVIQVVWKGGIVGVDFIYAASQVRVSCSGSSGPTGGS